MPNRNKLAAGALALGAAVVISLSLFQAPGASDAVPSLSAYEAMLNAHPYTTRLPISPEALRSIPKRDRPDLALEQDFLMTMDPATGTLPIERLHAANRLASQLKAEAAARGGAPIVTEAWDERGPSNVGGRTRATMFDPNDTSGLKFWAAGVAGGLWYTDDISDATAGWTAVNDFWSNMAVTSIAYDPSNTQIFYAGTGEGYFNADAVRGAGIFKSTDGGATWTQLAATADISSFHYVQRVAVHPVTGDVYAATRSGVFRSQDGGDSWDRVRNGPAADVEIASNDSIYATTGLGTTGRVFRTQSGDTGTWNQINTGTNGFPTSGNQRIELAIAPSNPLVIYAVAESNAGGGVSGMWRTDDGGDTWTAITRPNDVEYGLDFSRGQAWYDLSIAVDPNDPATAYVGGINLFRTTDSGASWTQISHWYGGFGYPEVHADQHAIAFRPGSSDEVVFSHDGGNTYTSTATQPQPLFINRNNGYNVTQFYAGAIAPEAGSNIMLAGAQDNGTQYFNAAGIDFTNEVRGGDGAFTFIDQTNSQYAISSYVYNTYNLSTTSGTGFPITLIDDQNTGSFINRADYDDREDILYSYRTAGSLYRVLNVTGAFSVGTISHAFGTTVTHLKVSPFAPDSTSTLFVGTSAGRVFRLDSAHATPVVTELTSPGSGSVSSIEFGATQDHMLLTQSNYGVVSVYESTNAGATWVPKEGNLPDVPVRWALFNPANPKYVILATEAGVWETGSFDQAAPNWTPAPGFPTVRTDMLQYRESDNAVMATTHGRGVFTSTFRTIPVANEGGPNAGLPGTHRLGTAYPNPFNPQTRFTLEVTEAQRVRLDLYDMRGRRLSTLFNDRLASGAARTFEVDGRGLASGTYIVRIEGERFYDQVRLSLVK